MGEFLATLNPFASGAESEGENLGDKIDLDDQYTLKHTLDEAAASYVTDILKFKEDFWSSNLKLGIMTFACAVALLAQFFPMPFPDSRIYVGICCALYFISSVVLQLVYFVVDGDVIFKSLPNSKYGEKYVQIRTNLERFQEDYTIIFEWCDSKGTVLTSKEESEKIGNLFTKDGQFYEYGVDKIMARLSDTKQD